MTETFVYVLLAISMHHGELAKTYVATFRTFETCDELRQDMSRSTIGGTYYCQKELLR